MAYNIKKMFVMLSLGFGSGLPYILLISTSTAWLRDVEINLSSIGFFTWLTFAYTFKFVWAPLVDRFSVPYLSKFGHRKSWILSMQILILLSLVLISNIDPTKSFLYFCIFAGIIAFAGSIQDIAIDAFRIEYAHISDQGNLAAAYQLGYRLAIIVATSVALIFADINGWSSTFKLMSGFMCFGLLGIIFSKENLNTELGKLTFVNSIIQPFNDFFSRFGFFMASMLLLIIATYRLTDIVMGPMASPFYIDMGFTLSEIGAVVKVVALFASIAGIFLGGILIKKIKIYKSLIIGAFLVLITNILFAYVAITDKSLFSLSIIVAMDSLAAGIVGTVNIAFLSSLVSKKYTGFQYALLTGFMAGPGFALKGLSGLWVEHLQQIYGFEYGWMFFYITTSLLTIPSLIFLILNKLLLIKHEKTL
ncbi:MFS transporter [Gammaproteobacteria bacterium]|nr:MFS transporter [Gammaproteobacteria bacterium]MDA9117526.1 MFS transporter [Gammaproteobacteria bacterium]MDC0410499.1 MFS transporter [Gammaproteobacteria bacterium]|tara:strand:- start:415 stop:1674 length:1260 start_codon:yes stop_codon:yes gene_type:complete